MLTIDRQITLQSSALVLTLDGIPLERLLECHVGESRGRHDMRVEVITWEPIVVAADETVLVDAMNALRDLVTHERCPIHLSIYPTHSGSSVTMEWRSDATIDMDDHHVSRTLDHVRFAAKRMGGDFLARTCESGTHASIWLPQWVTEDMFQSQPRRGDMHASHAPSGAY